MNDPYTAIEITVSRIIDSEGRMAIMIKTGERYSVVEVLGLLEAAKLHVFEGMRRGGDE